MQDHNPEKGSNVMQYDTLDLFLWFLLDEI